MMSKSSSAAASPRGLGTDDEEAPALDLTTFFFLTTGALEALGGLAALKGFWSRDKASSWREIREELDSRAALG